MLDVTSVSVNYGLHAAVRQVSLAVRASEIVVMLGSNGAGKSSLLKAMGGLVAVAAGSSVRMRGVELTAVPAERIVEHGLALVPEGRGLFGELSVAENLQLGAFPGRARSTEAANRDRVLRLFPRLTERLKQKVRTMSGGEQQMVAIGRALMSKPDILMLDEPSLGLSPLMCKELFAALRQVRALGVGVLLVEQNARQSLAIADRGYLLENGQVVGEGTAGQLNNDTAVRKAYLGS